MLQGSKVPQDSARALVSALQRSFGFELAVGAPHFEWRELSFYSGPPANQRGRAKACWFRLGKGSTVKKNRHTYVLTDDTLFAFLIPPGYDPNLSVAPLLPLNGNAEFILKANNRLGLRLSPDNALEYAQFYADFGKIYDPGSRKPREFDIPRSFSDIQLTEIGMATGDQIKLEGALWRFLPLGPKHPVAASPQFRTRYGIAGPRLVGKVPAQVGPNLFEVELDINQSSGSIKTRDVKLLYQSDAIISYKPTKIGDLGRKALGAARDRFSLGLRWLMKRAASLLNVLTLPLLIAAFVLTMLVPLLDLSGWAASDTVLPWIDAHFPARGRVILLITAASTLLIFAVYLVFWTELDNIIRLLSQRPEWFQETALIRMLVRVSSRAGRIYQDYDTIGKKLFAISWRLLAWTAIAILSFTTLQIAMDPKPFRPDATPFERPQLARSFSPSGQPTASGVLRVLGEQTLYLVPLIITYLDLTPRPPGATYLWHLPITVPIVGYRINITLSGLFSLFMVVIVLRGIQKFWTVTTEKSFERALKSGRLAARGGSKKSWLRRLLTWRWR